MGDPPSDLARPPIAVVGGGPAGLTAAYELRRLGQPCVVFEANPNRVGGIARTDEYKGYRFDIGGHRFFTKSDEVRQLWHRFLPDGEFLTVRRMSRIYYQGKFFDYPLKAGDALRKLGLVEAARCGLSYLRAAAGPKPTAVSFEDWVVQRFGRRLYQIFFKTYTEKVWGMPCTEISADWAAQRIKGLSLYRAVKQSLFGQGKGEVVKTLIDQFEYPRFGPGMMWEHLAAELAGDGVPVHLGATVARIGHRDGRVVEIDVDDAGGTRTLAVGGAISSMPLRSLVAALDPAAPEEVQAAAGALRYRDFLTVVLVIDRPALFPDNWIYIHEPSVKVGRIQNFKNWSPHMVPDPSRTCLGLEYFCFEGDGLWSSSDAGLVAQATAELQELRLAGGGTVIDGTVVRMPKAYPVYDDAYRANVAVLRDHLATVATNLELCGRNGMHKYNNQDHAMMTALMAARNMAGEAWDQWLVNEDAEYHEEERASEDGRMVPGPAQSPART